MIDITPKPNLLKSSSVKPANQLMPSASQQIVDVKNLNKVKEAIPEGVGKVDDVVDIGKVTSKVDDVKDLSKIKNISPVTSKISNTFDGALNLKNLNPLKALKNANTFVRVSGAAHTIPLLSSITGTINLMTGDYANAMLDYADSGADAAIIGGATGTAGMLAAGLSAAATVLSVGTLVGYVGEWTRGIDDWIRGDGENAMRNGIADITAGLSSGMEIIGAPFRGLFEGINSLIKTGNFDQSNKAMAIIDANIRESGRKFLNAIDFLGVVPDEVGGLGTWRAYGSLLNKTNDND